MDHPDQNKLKTYVESKVPSHVNFNVPYITHEEVNAFLHALDPSKATGIDELGPRILKMAASILSPSIAALINKSIQTASFPNHLKTAKICPIHKGGSKSDPTNYRPISILPTISKIFEKHINKHLMGFLNKYDLIHKNQSGFRPKHSCQTALIKLIDQWMSLIDHSILIKKLSIYKLRDSALKLFSSYILDRHQVMENNTGTTRPAHIKLGVPQGSILGPTLVQVLAFQKSWRSFSPITVCIIAQCQCQTGGTCPHPPRRGRGECPKKTSRIYMYGNGLVVFGVFWGGLGYFEAVGFQNRNLAHYMYGDGLVVFGGGLGCFG